jgi:glycosyltransferase involved in cell wall biosynthesis
MPRYVLYLADLVRGRSASHGIANTALRLAEALPGSMRAHERLVTVLNGPLLGEIAPPPGEVLILAPPARRLGRFGSVQVRAPLTARRLDADVVHLHGSMAPFLGVPGVRLVTTIHDDLPLQYGTGRLPYHPGFGRSRYARLVLLRALAASDAVVTVSEAAAGQLRSFARQAQIRAAPIHVVHPAPTLPLVPYVPLGQRSPVLLHLASNYPHKRTAEAVRFTLRYLDRADTDDLRLVLLGQVPEEVRPHLQDPRVEHRPGPATTTEIADLLARSRALVFTSGYEGFGLPPVEAAALGVPAVWARCPAVTEAVGDEPGGFDIGHEGEFVTALDEALERTDADLRAAADRVRARRTWEDVAADVRDVYASTL